MKQGDLEAAGDALDEALQIRQNLPASPQEIASTLDNIAAIESRAGNEKRSAAYLQRAVALREPQSLAMARSFANLGVSFARQCDTYFGEVLGCVPAASISLPATA